MTAPLSARDVVAGLKDEIRSVPSAALGFVCPLCLGPVMGYFQCYGCSKLFSSAPDELRGRVVPMSTVLNPSLWYRRLVGYKNGNLDDHTALAALTAAYLAGHENEIAALLEGPLTRIAVVPSTRGRSFEQHALAQVVRRSKLFRERLVNVLSYVVGSSIGRQEYKPSMFAADPTLVRGERVLLIEDLWVSGAKAVSAAGAVLEAGASSVVILPIAREVRESAFCPDEYIQATAAPFNVDAWPRQR